jgi:hypothetical protein
MRTLILSAALALAAGLWLTPQSEASWPGNGFRTGPVVTYSSYGSPYGYNRPFYGGYSVPSYGNYGAPYGYSSYAGTNLYLGGGGVRFSYGATTLPYVTPAPYAYPGGYYGNPGVYNGSSLYYGSPRFYSPGSFYLR